MHQQQPTVFSFRQFSDRLGGEPSPWTLARLAERGDIRIIRIGKRVFVPLAEVLRIEAEGVTLPSTRDTNRGTKQTQSPKSCRKE